MELLIVLGATILTLVPIITKFETHNKLLKLLNNQWVQGSFLALVVYALSFFFISFRPLLILPAIIAFTGGSNVLVLGVFIAQVLVSIGVIGIVLKIFKQIVLAWQVSR